MTEIISISNIMAVVDILIVAAVLYALMLMFRGSKAERMFWGLGVMVFVYFITQRVELLTLHWLLSNFLGSIVIFIIVVFQQDIRRALVRMGKPFSSRDMSRSEEKLGTVTSAVYRMSEERTGGIIAFERTIDLTDVVDAGVAIDAEVSRDLLLSIFNNASPLHDGAVLVAEGRLARASCILPLTDRDLPAGMGTRHRAAMGLAEDTDAVVVVISEQTGEVTLFADEEFHAEVREVELGRRLKRLLAEGGEANKPFFPWKAGA
jgi:diadenylate cyclase